MFLLPFSWINHYPIATFAPILFLVKNGKNGKPHVLQLQDKEDDGLQFDLAAGTLEELFEWYKVAWDITQRAMSQQYKREQEASPLSHLIYMYTAYMPHAVVDYSRRLAGFGFFFSFPSMCKQEVAVFFCPISDQAAGGSWEKGRGCYGDVGPGGLLSATQQREGSLR